GRADWKEIAREYLALSRASFAAALESPYLDDPRIHHVRYPDLVVDPVAAIRAFYAKYGVPFTREAEAAMRDYLRHNKSDRYGRFDYSTDVIGEDVEALHAEFAAYRERFGLEIERRR